MDENQSEISQDIDEAVETINQMDPDDVAAWVDEFDLWPHDEVTVTTAMLVDILTSAVKDSVTLARQIINA